MTPNRVSSYVEQLALSQALVARALRAYRSGLLDEAWRIAKSDPLLVPEATRPEWVAWAEKIVVREKEAAHEFRRKG